MLKILLFLNLIDLYCFKWVDPCLRDKTKFNKKIAELYYLNVSTIINHNLKNCHLIRPLSSIGKMQEKSFYSSMIEKVFNTHNDCIIQIKEGDKIIGIESNLNLWLVNSPLIRDLLVLDKKSVPCAVLDCSVLRCQFEDVSDVIEVINSKKEIQSFPLAKLHRLLNTAYKLQCDFFGQFIEKKLLEVSLVSDHSQFKLLMKLNGEDLCYSSEYWTNNQVLNSSSTDPNQRFNAKFENFNSLEIRYLMIKDESGRFSTLILPQKRTLLSIFSADEVVPLTVVDGCKDPYELATGFKGAKFAEPAWRINSYSTTHNFKVRIGGFYCLNWGNYGTDKAGKVCTAEMAGAGIEDKSWSPFVYAKKSFGVRAAHDNMNSPIGGNNGNLHRYALIYGL